MKTGCGGTRSVVGKFSGDGVDEACATVKRGWEQGTKGQQEAARGTTEERTEAHGRLVV